jgi:cardiolipin synthase
MIDVTIDDYGSPDPVSVQFLAELAEAGVCVHVFDLGPGLWGWRTNLFLAAYRKIKSRGRHACFCRWHQLLADHLA